MIAVQPSAGCSTTICLDDQEAQASIRCQLGSASSQAGQFRQARAQLERAFKLYKALGDENGQAQACISIGEAWSRQCRDREALDRTLDAVRPWPTDSTPPRKAITPVTRAVALNNLGWYHARLGELDQARTLCDQALQLFRDMRNPYGQAITRDSLGFIYHQLGNHDLAAVHYRLAADQYRQLGDFHNLADTLARLAESHEAAGDIAAARDAWPQAIALLDGMRHPDAQNRRDRLRQLDSLSGSTDSPAPCRREPKADPGRDA
jgi:tetratricopeptide (TPR) repeat protein